MKDRKQSTTEEHQNSSSDSRRRFLTKAGSVAGLATLGMSQVGTTLGEKNEFCQARQKRSKNKVLKGTEMEFPSYTIESKIPGPTVVVVGGLQGNEPVGWNTANKIRQWSIDSGKLVVLPQVNPVAIQRGTYVGRNGDLNDHFPPGRKPTTKLARAVWNQVKQANPDVFFSLHSSHGILGVKEGPDGVGQAIYPTYIGQARKNASQTVQFMNKQYLDSMRPVYDFKVGNTLDADRPLLTHKVAGDLKIPGYLVETTRYGTDLKTETKWMTAMVANLIRQSGIDIQR